MRVVRYVDGADAVIIGSGGSISSWCVKSTERTPAHWNP